MAAAVSKSSPPDSPSLHFLLLWGLHQSVKEKAPGVGISLKYLGRKRRREELGLKEEEKQWSGVVFDAMLHL